MKIKLLVIAVTLLLSGCYEVADSVVIEDPVRINKNYNMLKRRIDGHDYIKISGYTHSGSCRRCKQERDSIVNLIIKTIKENDN